MLAPWSEEEGEAKITRCQSNSGILGESDGWTEGDQISSGARARPQLMAQIDFGKVACSRVGPAHRSWHILQITHWPLVLFEPEQCQIKKTVETR